MVSFVVCVLLQEVYVNFSLLQEFRLLSIKRKCPFKLPKLRNLFKIKKSILYINPAVKSYVCSIISRPHLPSSRCCKLQSKINYCFSFISLLALKGVINWASTNISSTSTYNIHIIIKYILWLVNNIKAVLPISK